jgi:hypothetical protein
VSSPAAAAPAVGVTPPIVVYGAARSGTTYLVQILNRDPRFFISDETRVFVWAHRALHCLENDDLTRILQRDQVLGFMRRTLPGALRELYRELAPEAQWWGDKYPHYADPRNLGCLDSIVELYPGARFVHIVRDGRDVVTSGLRGTWPDFEVVHGMWTGHVDVGCAFGRALPAGQYFELTYEELVRDDLAMARRLFDFLGVDLHPSVERFCRKEQRRRTDFCTPTRDLSLGVARSEWASFLSPAEQVRSLDLLGEHLVRMGYETPQSLERARLRAAGIASEVAR